MNTITLYKHITDGGAIYLTTTEHDLYSAVLRLDGSEVEIVNERKLKKLAE